MHAKVYFILVIASVSILIIPVHGAGVTITAQNNQFQTRMLLSLHENMTDLPTKTLSLDASQDPNLHMAFANALQQVDTSAQLTDLTLQVTSTSYWLNVTTSMGVGGIATVNGDIASLNTTWKSFSLTRDLTAQNLTYNDVGRAYLRPVVAYYLNASRYEMKPNATISAVTFFSNGTSIPGDRLANQVGNFTLFDFSSLGIPLEQWNRTYNLQNDTTTWRYTPPQPLTASLSATRGLNNTFVVFANYAYDAEIVAPGIGRGSGNMLQVDVGSGRREEVMIAAVIIFVFLAIASQILYRSKKRKVILGRR